MLKKYLEKLDQYKNFEIEGNIDKFDEILGKIAELNDPNSIEGLIQYFDDDSDYPEVIFGIIHLIEQFDDDTYLINLLPNSISMFRESPYWIEVLHYRILNSPSTLEAYKAIFPLLSGDVIDVLKMLLEKIGVEDNSFSDRCNEILNQ